MKKRGNLLIVVLLIVILVVNTSSSVQAANPAGSRYIIVFKEPFNPVVEAANLAQVYGLTPGFIYQDALKGMSAVVPEGRLLALQHDPRVSYVVEDMQRSIDTQTVPTGIRRIFADTNPNIAIDGVDDYRVDVDVAVIDTGIDLQHPDLNVVGGVTCLGNIMRASCKPGGDDDHYHGTHVAGTIGALDNGIGVVGVAPGARLWAVKVLDSSGSGWSSEIIAGINWVAANASTIEVANMSLGGSGFNQAEYDAIQGAVNRGVAFAVAAGNNDDDARNYSPGGFNNVLSVSALADFDGLPGGLGDPTCRTDQDDTLADFSNWGPEVDVAAPGVCILSTYPLEQGEYGTISGTSMASPHAAGALALLASASNPNNAADVYNLYDQVRNAGNYNWTDDSGDGIKEPLVDVSTFDPVLLPTGGASNQPPAAGFNYTTSGLAVTFTDTSTDPDGTIVSWYWNFGDGSNSSVQNPIHTYATAGSYTVNLVVTDDDGATGSISKPVTVSDVVGGTITVSSLTASSSKVNKNYWKATVTAKVDPTLAGAAIAGTWSNGKTFSCTTVTGGTCSASLNVSSSLSSISLVINNVVLTNYTYIPGVTTITVYKP